jgi:hypothetical protein
MEIPKRRHQRWDRAALIGVALCSLMACGASLSVRAARSGDAAGLKTAIAREKAEGKLGRKRVRDIAREVGARELRVTPLPDVLARIDEARPCARALADALEERAKRSDDAAAAALLALLDASLRRGGDAESQVQRHGASASPLWRAVAARASNHPALGSWRRKFYVDPDERVRLAALRAAFDAPDPTDGRTLLEMARLDPNPIAQALAARALGGIADPQIVLALRDLFAAADEGLRQSIVDAWARPQAASVGGVRELVEVAENQEGAFAIEAGLMLLRLQTEPGASAVGKRALLRGMNRGLSRDRVLAIGSVPVSDPEVREGLRKAAETSDLAVKTAALARLTESAEARTPALVELRKIAEGGSQTALFALARARDAHAVAAVEKELSSAEPGARLAGMAVLVGVGEWARAAGLLADADPRVRMSSSCAILAAP